MLQLPTYQLDHLRVCSVESRQLFDGSVHLPSPRRISRIEISQRILRGSQAYLHRVRGFGLTDLGTLRRYS